MHELAGCDLLDEVKEVVSLLLLHADQGNSWSDKGRSRQEVE